MKIAAIREREKTEFRCAITPDVAKLYVKKGYKVFVENGIGVAANFSDDEFAKAGAILSYIPLEILADANIILKVQPTPLLDEYNEINMAQIGATIIGLLSPYSNAHYLNQAVAKKLNTIAMELVPRITKAQGMDVLSSQSNLAGYRAVIEAAYYFDRAFPMMMTAAGTINPAKTLILGIGVAGLQAIATAKRLGSVVSAYDVRISTKEQAESLGAKFVYPSELQPNSEDKTGYAKELSRDFTKIQEEFLLSIINKFDIVITTAQIPGKNAPILLTKEMVSKMNYGSVIIDLAASSGGNVEDTSPDELLIKKGVKLIGWVNMAAKIASDSSRLYAKNLYNFIDYAVIDGKINFQDELVRSMLTNTIQ